jgi:hypothetical protein
MKASTTVAAALLAASFAFQVHAQESPESGLTLGAKVGYALPMGEADKGEKLGDLFSGMVPLQAELGYRLDRSWSVGLYAQYGFVSVKSSLCPAGVSCSGVSTRLGVQGQYTFDRTPGVRPWLGAGVGFEWTSIRVSAGGASETLKIDGTEYLNLSAGGDWLVSPRLWAGPFITLTIAQYSTVSALGQSVTIPSDQKRLHQWLILGVKGSLEL